MLLAAGIYHATFSQNKCSNEDALSKHQQSGAIKIPDIFLVTVYSASDRSKSQFPRRTFVITTNNKQHTIPSLL